MLDVLSTHFNLFNSYGPLGNEALILHYGFALPSNLFEVVPFEVTMWKQSTSHGLHRVNRIDTLEFNLNFGEPCVKLLLAVLYHSQSSRRGWGLFVLACTQAISGMGSTFEQDIRDFKVAKDHVARTCLIHRCGRFVTSF